MPSLKTIMYANAASCLGFGLLFLIIPGAVAGFLAAPGTEAAPTAILMIIGGILVLNGVNLIHWGRRGLPPRKIILFFSAGDFLWVLFTLVIVAMGVWVSSAAGITVALLVALLVGWFGLAQMVARKRLGHC